MSVEYELIDDRRAFGEIREAWNDLAARTPVDHAFMRHEWFCNWWDHFPHKDRMRVVTGWQDGRLVAAAPLMIRKDHRKGVSFDLLVFMMSSISPRCTFLVDPDTDPRGLWDAVVALPGWDLAELKGLALDQPLTAAFLAYLHERGQCVEEAGAVSPYEDLPAQWEEFEKSRSKGYRKRFRNSLNRCKGADSFAITRLETFADFEARYQDLLGISQRSWKAEGKTDLVSQGGMAEFFRGCARDLDSVDGWVVYLLELDGKPVAFDYYIRHGNRLVGLRWEYDNDYRYYMPGVVLHVQAVKDLISEQGGGEYDLSGTETDFKSGLVVQAREHVDVTFGSGRAKSRLLMAAKGALFGIKKPR